MFLLSTDYQLSTAVLQQTDRQTEHDKLTMQQCLWAFCYYEQDNGFELLPLAEFAYNNAIQTSTRMTPFWANYHYQLVIQFKALKQ